MKKKVLRIVSAYLAINILAQIIAPTVLMALTTGPSQPEMQSFEPVGTTEMVDPFSGDFNYNIPLMTVPGPNGGYPINLAYHSGVGMEQEASWVGLGWNVNPGQISREMRGVPDDFNGDVISKQVNLRPNRTVTVGSSLSFELLNFDVSKGTGINLGFNAGLTWNNYKGIGVVAGSSISYNAGDAGGFSGGIHTNYNSMTGSQDLTPSLSYSKTSSDRENKFALAFTLSSNEGMKSISLDYSNALHKEVNKSTGKEFAAGTKDDDKKGNSYVEHGYPAGAGASYSGSSFIPHADMPQTGFSVGAEVKFGTDIFGLNAYVGLNAFYSQNKNSTNTINYRTFGFMYSQNRDGNDHDQRDVLMDVNREKDALLTKDIPDMPMPSFTNDVYIVKGQGIGGVFTPHRSDIGILYDPRISSENFGLSASLEIGSPTPSPFKLGADMTLSASMGYSGPWNNESATWNDFSGTYDFYGKDYSAPLFEPFYFRNTGDMTANDIEENDRFGGNEPFPIKLKFVVPSASDVSDLDPDEIFAPFVDVKVNNSGILGANRRSYRQSRSQSMYYKTVHEMKASDYGPAWTKNIYDLGDFPRTGTATSYNFSSTNTNIQDDHIADIEVDNPDGNRYIYSIPAYNISQKEISFSVTGATSGDNTVSHQDKIVDYVTGDATSSNDRNEDHFYSEKDIPPYAHSYMLTAIVSPDYVDLTGDGPSDDDYGYFVKFNYSKLSSNYNWRSPYTKASYMEGHKDVRNDDKAGFMYGQKETWYLTSIETKTHVAEFTLSDRHDGYGAYERDNAIGSSASITFDTGQKLKKLDKITLYSKNDPNYIGGSPTPIKTVKFEYNYDLCGNVENNDGNSDVVDGQNINSNKGKLTLRKVWFEYQNNNKGALSPYVFDYKERDGAGAIDSENNPDFSTLKADRWGNYAHDAEYSSNDGYNKEHPYVIQRNDFDNDGTEENSSPTADDTRERNAQASAWCLKKINLPSGGSINVSYEADDYAYVQEKPAMEMLEIAGTGSSDEGITNELKAKDNLVYFKMDKISPTADDVWNCVKGLDEVYFKAYERLKHAGTGGAYVYDYIDGYAQLDGPISYSDAGSKYGVVTISGVTYGYVKMKSVSVEDQPLVGGGIQTHPFRKAGWQYLKLNRPDLLYPSSDADAGSDPTTDYLLQAVNSLVGFFTSSVQLFTGYYKYCLTAGYCGKMSIDASYPSFIRLNVPDGIKYGGGHRVRELTVSDTWNGGSDESTYGQEYLYRLKDGRSSGVAEYEPLIGGEEIPHHMPIRYSSPYFLFKNSNLFMELPLCESYYPSPSVGYSRVVVKSITQSDGANTHTNNGITEYCYYTAKDFPVIVTPSNLSHKKFNIPHINIPFIGGIGFENNGFSQRYTVERNDMHGKQKSIATYSANTDLFDPAVTPTPVTKTEYIYKTDNAYSSSTTNHLNNTVDVLFGDANHKNAELGLTEDFFMDMRSNSNVSLIFGGQFNLELFFTLPFPNIMVTPSIDYSESLFKSMVAMHTINRNGVLIQTRQTDQGSVVTTDNLMFDAATGKPLLTTVTNDFDNPVYTYDYAAQWAYDGMGSAAKNIGAYFNVTTSTSISGFNYSGASNYFAVGDVVFLDDASTTQYFTVTAISSSGDVTLKDDTNSSPPNLTDVKLTIMRSGRRNQQSVSNGKIVSLDNPVTTRTFPLFDAWDALVTSSGSASTTFSFVNCVTGETDILNHWTITGNTVVFHVSPGGKGLCNPEPTLYFPDGAPSNIELYTLVQHGTQVTATHNNDVLHAVWQNRGCLSECMDNVLHATASRYKDDWSSEMSYVVNDVNNNNLPATSTPSPTDMTSNPYYYGGSGIWRNWETYAYQVKRKQGSPNTDISKDGTYENFSLFDFSSGATNPLWTKSMEVTRYSPYGFELENKDALGIYSSALYGYRNSLVTAIAQNSSYYETAFDGFEDYGTLYPGSGAEGHGHINISPTGEDPNFALVSTESHTGKKSLEVEDGAMEFNTSSSVSHFHFTPVSGKKYVLSCWIKYPLGVPVLSASGDVSTATGEAQVFTMSAPIEGWRKCDLTFVATGTDIVFTFGSSSGNNVFYLDDVRIMPFQSAIKTYVYDPEKLWLVAELDNQNYATFYNYDEEGTLTQVKKETVRGIVTIKSTRSHVQQTNP